MEDLVLAKDLQPGFEFTHSPMINVIHRLQIEYNIFLKKALEHDLTKFFFQDLDFRVKNERNLNLVISGETGSGKSFVSHSIYWELWERAKKWINKDLEFSVKNICFTRNEWLERGETLLQGDTLCFDEDDQGHIGTGSLRQLEEQERIEKTLRQSQFNFLFCSPLIEQHVEHYILKAFDIDYKSNLNRALVMKRDEVGMIMPYGYIVLKKHELPGYQEKKQLFRTLVQARTVNDRFKEYDDAAKWCIEHLHIDALKKKRTQKSLIQRYFPRFVEEEVKEIMTSVELISEKIELNYPFGKP